MKTVNVVICTGTTCYVMGAGHLLGLKEHLDEDVAQRVNITGASCLSLCKDDEYGKAPFVRVNDTLITEATIPKIIQEINQQLQNNPATS